MSGDPWLLAFRMPLRAGAGGGDGSGLSGSGLSLLKSGQFTAEQIEALLGGGEVRAVHDAVPRRMYIGETDAGVYQAIAMKISLPDEAAEGDLGELVIEIPNVGRLPQLLVDQEDRVVDQPATVYMCLAGENDTMSTALELAYPVTVLRADISPMSVRLTCGHTLIGAQVPSRSYDRDDFPALLPAEGDSL